MVRRKRQATAFNLSFLDIMSCGFGAVILVFLIIDHSIEVQIKSVNAEVLSEVDLLEEDILEGEAGLVRLRNALDSIDLDIVEAQGRARVVTEELDRFEAMIASLEESDVSETTDLDALKAEINSLEERIQQLKEAAEADGGQSAREFQGEGNRQYLTGLKLGGNRIAILIDVSSSMLAPEVVNIIRLRNQSPDRQRQARKWNQAIDTLDWLTAQLMMCRCVSRKSICPKDCNNDRRPRILRDCLHPARRHLYGWGDVSVGGRPFLVCAGRWPNGSLVDGAF